MKFPHQKSQSKIVSALSHFSHALETFWVAAYSWEHHRPNPLTLSHSINNNSEARERTRARGMNGPMQFRIRKEKIIAELIHLTRARSTPANYFLPPKNFHPQNLSRYMPCTSKICFAARETLKEIENKKDDAENEKERNGMLTRRREESWSPECDYWNCDQVWVSMRLTYRISTAI
jgi:hypothetical protein